MSITGECFCGEISYQVTGKLGDTTSCHCSRCRKAFSSQASASALVQSSQFTWLKGESLLSTYSSAQGFGLQFCKLCGSTLCTIYKGEVFQIMLGCINGSPDIEIGKHIYVGSKAKWEVMPSEVTQFDKGA